MVAILVLEGVHLFIDDIGAFADPAHEEVGDFEDRCVELLVAEQARHRVHLVGEVAPVRSFGRQNILHATECLIHGLSPGRCSVGGIIAYPGAVV